ncbi:hypothetical protein [Pseudorhizobium marinum]|uniref:hypothetical protein n=1 Tax=Pseudorhizobium marinum TaxID=1496690 RepID=UPI000495D6E0|nr:hypothetical protein [Pseudorhizobium marinum]MBU1314482.1 hypothetical protein [Alphaproteobacteria bacterium]MBU1551585.1 hypothetical protein [Alphaproteobacteria bacterium]MBU2337320.1 hypothetical protein [Alphaproteobacteria bacterium]MBU2388063.1 hypothetical protein [Alphaproteobacteria bacterium]
MRIDSVTLSDFRCFGHTSNYLAELTAVSDISAARGELEDHGRQLQALLGRPTTPYQQPIEAAFSVA